MKLSIKGSNSLQMWRSRLPGQRVFSRENSARSSWLNTMPLKRNTAIISRQLKGGNSRPEIRQSETALGKVTAEVNGSKGTRKQQTEPLLQE